MDWPPNANPEEGWSGLAAEPNAGAAGVLEEPAPNTNVPELGAELTAGGLA